MTMTKRCLYARCRSCGGLMYINEAEVVTCGCPEFGDENGVPIPEFERVIERLRRNSVAEVEVSRYVIRDDESKP